MMAVSFFHSRKPPTVLILMYGRGWKRARGEEEGKRNNKKEGREGGGGKDT